MPTTTDGRISKIKLPNGKVYDVGSGGSGTVDQTYSPTSTNAQSGTAVAEAVSDKVDKVSGKGLSTNDYTNSDKNKLDLIESGAQQNVQSDWTETDTSSDAYINNKPTIPDVSNFVQKTGDTSLSGTFRPSTTNNASLGTSSYKFSNLYVTNINGNPALTADSNGVLPVAQGGTSRNTLTSNAIIAGNGTGAVKMIGTTNGALYATSTGGAAQFGTLPVAQGGTGVTTIQALKEALDIDSFSTPIHVTETTMDTLDGSKIFSGTNAPFGTNIDWTGIQIGSNAGADGDIFQLVSAGVSGDNRLLFRKNDGSGWSDWTSVVLKDTLTSQIEAADTAAQGYANSAKTEAKAYTDSEIDTLEGEYGTTWNDNSDWASAPWYPIATIDVTTTYTNVTLALHIQRGNGTSQKSVGTLVVTARVNESFTNITSFNSAWTNVEDGLLADDTYYKVRATCTKYDNKATFAVWLKLSTRYDSFSYRKIRGAYRNSKSDNGFDPDCWVINSWKNVNGYSLYNSGDDVIQCVPSFGDTVKSSLSFMYNDTSSYEQGTASNPVYVYHGSVKLSTDDVSGTHTDYTIKLPKKNGTIALLSDLPTVPTDYVPLGGTSSNSPVTGTIEFTGSSSYLLFDTNNTGVRFIDSSSDEFSGVAWNGANFWIGARAGSQPTHAGKTYISTGWDTTNNVGYNTIAISIPRAKDGSTTAVTRYVVHTGDNTFNTEDTLDEAKEIKLNNSSYSKDIRFRATNSHSDLWFGTFGSSNDGGGIYNITGGGFVMKSSTASGSLVNTFYGNATTADSAGSVTVTDISDTTTEKTYRVTQSPTTTGTGRNQYSSAGLQVVTRHNYYTRLEMGNTSENAVLRMYGSGAYYTNIEAGAPTANRTITFPNKTGTVALTSDIQTSAVTNSTVSTSGSGNAITALSISSGQIVATKGSTFMAASGNTSMSNTFEPQSNYGANLGSSSYRFNNLYVRYINGDAPTSSVTSGSSALVTSGGVYNFLEYTELTITAKNSNFTVNGYFARYYPALHMVVGHANVSIASGYSISGNTTVQFAVLNTTTASAVSGVRPMSCYITGVKYCAKGWVNAKNLSFAIPDAATATSTTKVICSFVFCTGSTDKPMPS